MDPEQEWVVEEEDELWLSSVARTSVGVPILPQLGCCPPGNLSMESECILW